MASLYPPPPGPATDLLFYMNVVQHSAVLKMAFDETKMMTTCKLISLFEFPTRNRYCRGYLME